MNGYIRKTVCAILALIFCVAVVVCTGVMTSVRNVNIEYIYYSDRASDDYMATIDNLNALKGSNLILLGEEDVTQCLSGNIISVESCEKVYPCTLNVVLKERLEQYAVLNSSGGYDVYDADGELMGSRAQNINPADDSPNVLLYADGEAFGETIEICSQFSLAFGGIRNIVESVQVSSDPITGLSAMTFNLYSGLRIVLVDYAELSGEKVREAYAVFSGLSESQKLRGSIHCVTSESSPAGAFAAYNELI